MNRYHVNAIVCGALSALFFATLNTPLAVVCMATGLTWLKLGELAP
jgi:hypothetical protein